MQRCQLCFEENIDDILACKRCGQSLKQSRQLTAEKPPWYFKTSVIVMAVGSVGPLALPLIWFRPQTSRTWKIIWTVVILAASWWLVKGAMDTLNNFKDYSVILQQLK